MVEFLIFVDFDFDFEFDLLWISHFGFDSFDFFDFFDFGLKVDF